MEYVTKIGYCRFCHESRMVEVPEDSTQDLWNAEAVEQCGCYKSAEFRKKRTQKEVCIENINVMLAESRPEIADILENCIDAMQENKIKKITINTYGNFTVRMYANKDGIKIEKEKKTKEENLA